MAKKVSQPTKNNEKKNDRPQNKNLMPPIKKGEVRNPHGRPKLTEIERKAKEASRSEIAETWMRMKSLSLQELQKIITEKTRPSLELWMASTIIQGIRRGDMGELHKFYDRLLGKPRQDIDLRVEEVDSFSTDELSRMLGGEE